MERQNNLKELLRYIQYLILVSTTEAGSGHPTSSLSAADLMTVLFFDGFFRYKISEPEYENNDRIIFSKGHAAPLFYSLWSAAGAVSEQEMKTLRKFDSNLEGHPTRNFKYTETATGSLGQGLSVGAGCALNAKINKLPYRTFVLLGDGELAEGSVWEALAFSAKHNLNNLVAIADINRLGQRGETMYGHDIDVYKKRAEAFGWNTIVIDGHAHEEIASAYKDALAEKSRPSIILAKTFKGHGISSIEDKENWHGKPLTKEQLENALAELGDIHHSVRGNLIEPANSEISVQSTQSVPPTVYTMGENIATRKAYGNALVRLHPKFPKLIALDGETGNSTFSQLLEDAAPEKFLEMYIAEQNMVGVALGLARRGNMPFVSTFATFFTRAFDQIRMSRYSEANITFVGSHAGVSIGEDGVSQMGLEDIALFRSILDSVVLYPSDAVSTERVVELAAEHAGITYIRTTRQATPVTYDNSEEFTIGGSKMLRKSNGDVFTLVGAGITLFEALKAHEELKRENIATRVIDLYGIKPVDAKTLIAASNETKAILVIEDHYKAGGISEAVLSAVGHTGAIVHSLSVGKMPRSATPEQLLEYEGISKNAIIKKVKELL